jgi:hypothetical protein
MLGEDPEQFQTLTEELMSAFGPGDALWEKQIEDLAWLYWRRERLERAQQGLKRRALQAVDDWQHRRRQEMARVTFDASQHEMLDVELSESTDRGVTLRKTLSLLEVIQDQVKQRTFRLRQVGVLESLYKGAMGWRAASIRRLLQRFSDAPRLARATRRRGRAAVPARNRRPHRAAGRARVPGASPSVRGGNREPPGRIRICRKGE